MIHALDWMTALTSPPLERDSKEQAPGYWCVVGLWDLGMVPEASVPFLGVNPYLQLSKFLWDSRKGKVNAGKRKKMTSCLEQELFPVPCDAHKFVYAVREAESQLLLLQAGKAPLPS